MMPKALYDRGQLNVPFPELNKVNFTQNYRDFRPGRKLFGIHKNMQTYTVSPTNSMSTSPPKDYQPLKKSTENIFKRREASQRALPPQEFYRSPTQTVSKQQPPNPYDSQFSQITQELYTDPNQTVPKQFEDHPVNYYSNQIENYTQMELPPQELPGDPKPYYGQFEQRQNHPSQVYENFDRNQNPPPREDQRETPQNYNLERKAQESPSQTQPDIYYHINKDLYDKQMHQRQIQDTSQSLEYQVYLKEQQKNLERIRKENEQAKRLEDLRRMREDEIREKQEQYRKSQEYRGHLDKLNELKQELNQQESLYRKMDVPRVNELPPPNNVQNSPKYNPFQKDALSFYESKVSLSPQPMFTKKNPKLMSYNPITGMLRDTSKTLSLLPQAKSVQPYGNIFKNSDKVAVNYSKAPEFQQERFTKAHPKVQPSFPITGINYAMTNQQDFKKDVGNFFGVDQAAEPQSRLAQQGSYLMRGHY